jgi:hypothetical protein
MKNHVVALLLAALSCAATASWVKVSEDSESIGYYDPATLVRTGTNVTVAELSDFRRAATSSNDHVFRSARIQSEYDCAGALVRIVSTTGFEGPMGEGRALDGTTGNGDWDPIVLGSARGEAFNLVCGR